MAEEKKEILLTGGGPLPKKPKLNDDVDSILLSIMNSKTVQGLSNSYDSDNCGININNETCEFIYVEEGQHNKVNYL